MSQKCHKQKCRTSPDHNVARASPGRRKVESLSVLAALVAGQPILEPITIGFVGDKDMGSELQNRRAIEGSGRDIDQRS